MTGNLTDEQKERIRKFAHVLRTTKKQQGVGKLIRYLSPWKKEYCCLGIACELAIKDGLKLDQTKKTIEYYGASSEVVMLFGSSRDETYSVLPTEVMRYFGFTDDDPTLRVSGWDISTATDLNDERRYSFEQIADAFERTYLRDNNEPTIE